MCSFLTGFIMIGCSMNKQKSSHIDKSDLQESITRQSENEQANLDCEFDNADNANNGKVLSNGVKGGLISAFEKDDSKKFYLLAIAFQDAGGADSVYQIEFGNGIKTTVTIHGDSPVIRPVFFYSYDLDNDGQNEIIVHASYWPVSNPWACMGTVQILKKYGNEYRSIPIPVNQTVKECYFEGIEVETVLKDNTRVVGYIPVCDYQFELECVLDIPSYKGGRTLEFFDMTLVMDSDNIKIFNSIQ